MTLPRTTMMVLAGLGLAAAAGVLAWLLMRPHGPGPGFASGNGRIEATEVDVASKLAGRVQDILVQEGDDVLAGQPLVRMQLDALAAQREQARAQSRQAADAVASAEAGVAVRRSDRDAAQAAVALRASDLDAAERRFARTEALIREGASTVQRLDDERAGLRGAEAGLAGARAQAAAAEAAITAAQAQVAEAVSGVAVGEAGLARVQADIADSLLTAPRAGRVQYRVAEPGEVLAAGGTVLNLVDLGDVYMTFFLPEAAAGRVRIGGEARIVLDAAPQFVLPAVLTYVASTAQFTPKTVETASERQKLMFRVKARLDPALLARHRALVKTGLPGMAWLRLDAHADWPEGLRIRVPE